MPRTGTRARCRADIVAAANRGLYGRTTPFTMRQLQLAVFRCRQLRLVPDATLIAAGFQPHRRPAR